MADDIFDEFEFKPLTEGLGFQKKSVNLREKIRESDLIGDRLTVGIPNPPSSFELSLETPLPRERSNHSEVKTVPVQADVEPRTVRHLQLDSDIDKLIESLREPGAKPQFSLPMYEETPLPEISPNNSINMGRPGKMSESSFVEDKDYETETTAVKTASWSATAALVDGLVVAALVLVALIVMLVTIKVDLLANILSDANNEVMLSLAALSLVVAWIYTATARTFAFATVGDWVMDQEVGFDAERAQPNFPARVAIRFVANAMTGFILFPILSAVFNKDFLGSLLGVTRIERRHS